jgi:hypothetical protein
MYPVYIFFTYVQNITSKQVEAILSEKFQVTGRWGCPMFGLGPS